MEFLKFNSKESKEIKKLFEVVFTDSEGKVEGELIGNLAEELIKDTNTEDLYIFVAMDNKKIIACIIFSKLKFEESSIKAFLLAPVAVHTAYQKNGIGQKLIKYGHDYLKKDGIEIVVTYGDINFYSKVGYRDISEEILRAPLKLSYPEGWLAQSFISDEFKQIKGNSYCVEAINKQVYW